MHFQKPATDIEHQIALLKERGMVIADEALAERWMKTVGYYRLSAYWLPHERPPAEGETRSKQFRDGTAFEAIVEIYIFDRNLRLLVMEAIERIEIALRARWTNRVSLAHGPHAHLDPDHFTSGWTHADMVAQLARRAGESRELFIEHYKAKYDRPYMPPLWMVTELMTFGELSKWVSATRETSVRKAIAKDLGLPSAETLEGVLSVLSYVRNICAHHARLWNRKTVKRIPRIKKLREDLAIETIAVPGGQQVQPSNLIYNVLVILVHMMRHQASDTTYPARLKTLLAARSADQQSAMGAPDRWQARGLWSDPDDQGAGGAIRPP